MFLTYETSKRKNPLVTSDEYLWDEVRIAFNRAWFFVTCQIKSNNEYDFDVTLLVYDVNQIIQLKEISNLSIRFVDVVTPSYMNGSVRWKMEPLQEIWLCSSDTNPEYQNHVYFLENGSRYTEILAESFVKDFTEDRLIFSMAKSD